MEMNEEKKSKRYLSGLEIQDLLARKNTPQERPPRPPEEEPPIIEEG